MDRPDRPAAPVPLLHDKDFWSGLLFAAFGAAALLFGRDYPMGTPVRMGPGFFPLALGGLLLLIGLVLVVKAVLRGRGAEGRGGFGALRGPGGWARWRAAFCLTAAVLVFALAVRPLGFVLATFLTIIVAAAAGPGFHWRETPLLGLAVAGFATLLFVLLLGLPFALLPAFLR